MFEFEANEATILETQKTLEAALSSNPHTEKVLRRLIRRHVLAARAEVVNSLPLNHDPRSARQAVRTTVYRRVLGANINLLNGRKAHGESHYEPVRTLREGQRGGNRVPRSGRTSQVMRYAGPDRGFVVRFLNAGTGERTAGTRGGRLSGNRGSIAAGNFFRGIGDRAMGRMADALAAAIETEMSALLPQP